MKAITTLFLAGMAILLTQVDVTAANQQSAPSTAGGFTLNRSIDDYNLDTESNFIKEVIVFNIEGFRKGFITYGTCENPGKIVHIKLKYADQSYEFFETLLARYKQQFGSKPEFSGDRFGNVKSWKWTLTNEDGQRVSLTLQHNLKDSDESIGNTVKLSLPDQLIAERECFNKIHPQKSPEADQTGEPDWSQLIPR